MKLNRKEHNRFIQWLDRTAETNPLLWLPCVLMLVPALTGESIAEYAKMAYSHRNTGKAVTKRTQIIRKPFALRTLAVTLAASFSLMLVPAASFDVLGEEYDPTEQTLFEEIADQNETAETEIKSVSEEVTVPGETTVTEVTSVSEEVTVPGETTVTEVTSVSEEVTVPNETTVTEVISVSEEVTVPSETAVFDGTTYTEELKLTAEICNHRFEQCWESNETEHWKECVLCGLKKDEEEHDWEWDSLYLESWQVCCVCGYMNMQHDFEWIIDDDGHYGKCTECDYEIRSEHNFIKRHDMYNHWQECIICQYKKDEAEHRFDSCWEINKTTHWHECVVCGLKKDEEEHDWEWDSLYSEHWLACSVCGKWSRKMEHDYKWKYNKTEHWEECICGERTQNSPHKFTEGIFTITEDGETYVKRYICVDCGYFYDEKHIHSFGSEWESDSLSHWRECTCGAKKDSAVHKYKVKVTLEPTETTTGTKVYTCKVCSYSYTETIPVIGHTHTFGSAWHNDANNHWHKCTDCDERTAIAAHVSDGGTVTTNPTSTTNGVRTYSCSVCGYVLRTEILPATGGGNIPGGDNSSGSNALGYPSAVVIPSASTTYRLPYISDDQAVEGWENIAAYINASPDGDIVPITMNGENELPKSISECIRSRDITLRINMNGGVVWTVNGFYIDSPKTVNLRVSSKSNKIPDGVIDALGSELPAKEYRLYHNGNFGFRAMLTLNVSSKYNDRYAELYHYDVQTGQLEFVDESLVSDKQVTFELTHASYYVVAFSSVPLYDDVSANAGVFEDMIPITTSAMPETNGVTVPAVKLPQIMKCSDKKRRYRILKRRRLDDMVFVY